MKPLVHLFREFNLSRSECKITCPKYLDRKKLHQLKAFKSDAMSIQEASKLKGVDRSYFSNLIKLGHIIPVSGPGVDGYGNFFLDRKWVEEHTNENWWE